MRVRRRSSTRWQRVPDGMRDLDPAAAEQRTRLAARLRDAFRRWGYREVIPPTLEYLETFVRGAGPGVQDALFKVVDTTGALLAVRPEMTVPIARMAATRLLVDALRPLRIAYVGSVLRGQEAGRGRLREFTQAGVELLGGGGLDADAEVIALAADCLGQAGVSDAAISVGHLGFLNDLLAALPDEAQEEVRARLYRKEFVGIEDAVADASLARILRAIPDLHGPASLQAARALALSPRCREALDELESLLQRLRDYGLADAITVDLSIIRDFSYYTGVVFEAYARGAGYPLLGGGRYDGLLERFGLDCPATGFAIGLERVLTVVPEEAILPVDLLLCGPSSNRPALLQLAAGVRAQGRSVVVELDADWTSALQQAERDAIAYVAWFERETVRLRDIRAGVERTTERAGLLDGLPGHADERVVVWTH